MIGMSPWFEIVGDKHTVKLFDIRLLGVNAENGKKLLVTIGVILAVLILGKLLHLLLKVLPTTVREKRAGFWLRQAVRLLVASLLMIGVTSIWFDNPERMATVLGLITAGIAFALQKVVTSLAGYLIILRGKTFTVGDRITMGGVRGDVIALGLMQTTIMEMGQPPGVNEQADPAMWVKARQYTGRIVTVTNDKIFETPVFNYSKEFPYLWEEMWIPVSFTADRARAETILLDAAKKHTVDVGKLSEEALAEMERRYVMRRSEIGPRVYWRITDNWVELTVRFICFDHGIRDVKDAMAREILPKLDEAGIGIASSTYDIVGFPKIRVETVNARGSKPMASTGDGDSTKSASLE
jgi:small-conductance mechanosensitive channel